MQLFERFNYSENPLAPRYADVYKPEGNTQAAKIGLVFLHGGAWKSGTPKQFEHWARHFSEEMGFLSVSLDYRLSTEDIFPAPVEDLNGVIRWLRKTMSVEKVVVIGTSAGANIAATAMTAPTKYQGESGADESRAYIDGAVLLNGEYDMWHFVKSGLMIESMHQYVGESAQQAPHLYDAISPLKYIEQGMPKTLLLHGDADVIPFEQSQDFHLAMLAQGNDSEFQLYPKKKHNWFLKEEGGETLVNVERFIVALINN